MISEEHSALINQSYEEFFTPCSQSQFKMLSHPCSMFCTALKWDFLREPSSWWHAPMTVQTVRAIFSRRLGCTRRPQNRLLGFSLSRSSAPCEPNGEEWIRYAVTQRGSGQGRKDGVDWTWAIKGPAIKLWAKGRCTAQQPPPSSHSFIWFMND